jgi:ribosomal protein S18 acetylase RimI-like enzyme
VVFSLKEMLMELPEGVNLNFVQVEEQLNVFAVTTVDEARRVSNFLLLQESFNSRLTPGEEEMARTHPLASLHEEKSRYWYVENGVGEIVAVNGVKEDEHKNNGYTGAFLAVSRRYRKKGLAGRLFNMMLDFIREKKGRHLLIDTSDREDYRTIRLFLQSRGFRQVGYFPDHYYQGEGTYWYYKKMNDHPG